MRYMQPTVRSGLGLKEADNRNHSQVGSSARWKRLDDSRHSRRRTAHGQHFGGCVGGVNGPDLRRGVAVESLRNGSDIVGVRAVCR